MDKPRDIPKPVKPTPEQMGRQLETKVSQQRPNKILLGMLLVLLALLPVGFLLWFFWPGPEPPKIIAVGFDELAFPGKPVELTGLLIKADPSEEGIVGGWPVNFEFFKPEMLKNPEAKLQKTTSAPDGSAQAKFHLSGKIKLAEFAFRFTPENAEKFAEDRASVFLVNPKQLILVDVESALAKAAIREWESKSLNDIPRNISAAKFLGTKAKAGFSIVYFACTVPSPITYRRVRFWVQSNPPKDVPPFPRGPVLGKPKYHQEMAAALKGHLKVISEHVSFDSKDSVFAVSGNTDVAGVFKEAGIQTYLISQENQKIPGVRSLKEWEELSKE